MREIVQRADNARSEPGSCGFSSSESTLLNTASTGAPIFFTRSTACASSSVNGASASTTNSTTSASAAARTVSIMRLFSSVSDL